MRHSVGTFTVTDGPDTDTATVTLQTTFEPLDPAGTDELTTMIHGAFHQSLESLRRFRRRQDHLGRRRVAIIAVTRHGAGQGVVGMLR